jgi:uncharacterized protein YecT (DUF1311 family)
MTARSVVVHAIAWIALSSATACFAMPPGNPPSEESQPPRSPHQGDTQRDVNDQARADYKAADREMNRVYTAVLSKYAKDATFIAKLKAAQRAWLVFRDADMAANYPDPDPQSAYGSAYPMCMSRNATELTRQRTEQLKVWLKGTEEGDICAGSVHINGDPD